MQTDFPDVSGYVHLLEYQTKKHHRQLTGALLCARCGDLSHGHMVNAVAGQGGARVGAGLLTPIPPVPYTHLRAHETPAHPVCMLLMAQQTT